MQKKLDEASISNFRKGDHTGDQLAAFTRLYSGGTISGAIADIGGGCGFFAEGLLENGYENAMVYDTDQRSLEICLSKGVPGRQVDALAPPADANAEVVCFNLMLHHLVGSNDRETTELQKKALQIWSSNCRSIFVNEYIYESFFLDMSARLIYEITRSRLLSFFCSKVAIFIPALNANTFGVGVRFRSHESWKKLFDEVGLRVDGDIKGDPEPVHWAYRALFIKAIRRDSFSLSVKN